MKALNAHEKRLAGLARSVRAAIVVPSLFALALLVFRQPAMAGFAVFGTFAHLVMIDYDTAGTARAGQCAALSLLGAITIALGTLTSASVWVAVAGTLVAGFLIELLPLLNGRMAAIRTPLLLSFMLAVAAPAPAGLVSSNVAGWLLAGIAAQPALLLIWVSLQATSAAEQGGAAGESIADRPVAASGHEWIANAASSGMAMAVAVLLARILEVNHAFWIVLGAAPLLSANVRSAAQKFWQQQLGTSVGFLLGVIVVTAAGPHQTWYWTILPFIVFGSAFAASAVGFMAGQAAFTVFVVVLFCILMPQQTEVGILRVADIAIGGLACLLLAALRQLVSMGLWTVAGERATVQGSAN
ncbi:MAG TPA: FUSC family protein [Xanthobacteraceae bacterium]|jgi:hypothetical protein